MAEVAREEIGRILPIRPGSDQRPLPAKPKVHSGRRRERNRQNNFDRKAGALSSNKNGHSVLLAAADTFRAAAIEQLGIWAERLGVEMIRGQYNADPAALCYEAYQAADTTEHRVSDLRHRRAGCTRKAI